MKNGEWRMKNDTRRELIETRVILVRSVKRQHFKFIWNPLFVYIGFGKATFRNKKNRFSIEKKSHNHYQLVTPCVFKKEKIKGYFSERCLKKNMSPRRWGNETGDWSKLFSCQLTESYNARSASSMKIEMVKYGNNQYLVILPLLLLCTLSYTIW